MLKYAALHLLFFYPSYVITQSPSYVIPPPKKKKIQQILPTRLRVYLFLDGLVFPNWLLVKFKFLGSYLEHQRNVKASKQNIIITQAFLGSNQS